MLRTDYFADITIFDPDKVRDLATFDDPNKPSVGVEYVFVNGTLALQHDKVTGQLGGRPLRGPGYIMRDYLPEGLPLRGKVPGVVTAEGGWPLPRATITILDASGKVVGSAHSRRNGSYEIVLENPYNNCLPKAERMGFATQQRSGVNYNGSNSLWFGFALGRSKFGVFILFMNCHPERRRRRVCVAGVEGSAVSRPLTRSIHRIKRDHPGFSLVKHNSRSGRPFRSIDISLAIILR